MMVCKGFTIMVMYRKKELAEDIIALIHSFLGKLYGLRHKIKKGLEEDDKES